MTHSEPKLSIGLPVYNGERYLSGTLDSLLGQSYAEFELIVSDNASTDGTEDICRDYCDRDPRVAYHRYDVNRGAAWNFNNAVRLSRGRYFKWAAHDDLYAPTFLERCVEVLDRDPEVVLCFSRTDFIDDQGAVIREYPFPVDVATASRRRLFRLYAGGGHIVHEVFGIIRSSTLRETKLIDGYVGSDLVLLGKLALRGRFHQVPERLFLHREHAGRSTIATAGVQGFTQWYDSSKSGRFVAPYWRRIYENAKSVAAGPIPAAEKPAYFLELGRTANWNRRALLNDVTRLLGLGSTR